MHKYSAKELNEAFIKGDLTALEITQHFLGRVRHEDEKVGAFLNVLSEKALKKASDLDEKRSKGEPLGKLAGIPIAIKDNIQIKGELTTCGSKFLSNYTSPYDATVIDFIEKEDGIIIGKTNLDEFAMGSSTENSAFQKTGNPWKLSCSPGGSSGGSAAAVAARFCPLSLGSETGGSVRQPAALTGTVGFKPTYGRVSRYGLVSFGSSLDAISPFATNVEDIALFMEVIGKHCKRDSTSLPVEGEPYTNELATSMQGKVIGVPRHALESLPEEIKQNFEQSLKICESLGAKITDIEFPLLKSLIPTYYIVSTAEASTNLARFDGIRYGNRSPDATNLQDVYEFSRRDGFGDEVQRRILLGTFVLASGYQDAYYKKSQKIRTLLIEYFEKMYETCHLIAMPTTPTPTFELGEIVDPMLMYMQDQFTVAANLAGLPAISVPSGFNKEDKPLGFQLMGPQLEDARVLRFAHQFEKEAKISPTIPPLFDKEVR